MEGRQRGPTVHVQNANGETGKKGGNPLEKFGLSHNEAMMTNGGLFNHQTAAAAGFKDQNLNYVILSDRKCKHRRRKL